MNVVIVESPAKAKTINKYLGKDYKVLASYGHVRDLPAKDGSVNPDDDFAMTWSVPRDSSKHLNDITDALKGADKLFLATDPDREGEAISWHVLEVLKKKKALKDIEIKRVVFNEITRSAITKGIANPRDLDMELVEAYLARRALDYLVGFTLSPVLWRKLPGARSAGRVQSVALRLICERELEIERFKSEEFWTIEGAFTANGANLQARLSSLAGTKLGKFDLPNEASAKSASAKAAQGPHIVQSVEKKPVKRHPYPPFTTSTLQQEAARKLGFNAQRTMRVAQALYEGKSIGGEVTGLITYMRTDGVSMAGEAIAASRKLIETRYGERYVPTSPRMYKSKAKNAQEAHEAIRPTDPMRRPIDVAGALDDDERKLYELIWKRTIASQMASAELERTTIAVQAADGSEFRTSGSVIRFDGFLTLYQESRDDDEDEAEKTLPALTEGQELTLASIQENQHFTEAPPRFSEASLVKKLEELGIGRPSTYASILTVLRERSYVHMDKNRFIPDDKGRIVTVFLEHFFARYVEYDFTAQLEEQLDNVSAGEMDWKQLLRDFWGDFKPKTDEVIQVRNAVVIDALDEYFAPILFGDDGTDSGKQSNTARKCPSCDDGLLGLKTSRFGAFIGCSNYPECGYTRPFATTEGEAGEEADGERTLGTDPETGLSVDLKKGRFGPYIQLGEAPKGEKPKRASLPKGLQPSDITLEKALQLLSLPRLVGQHPETGKDITAAIGRFGPYVAHDGAYASLPSADDVFTVGINHAVSLIADAAAKKRGGAKATLKDLGTHPEDGEPVRVMDGRYGPYVNHKKINATLPKDTDLESVTLEMALELIAAKASKGSGAKKSAGTKAAAKKATTKKAPAKKATPKKTAPKKTAAKKPAAAKTAAKTPAKKAASKTTAKKAAD